MNAVISPSRRRLLKLTGAAGLAALSPGLATGLASPVWAAASAAGTGPRHGLSVFGELKYAPDFKHFDYVNPEAPKGGKFIFQAPSWAYNQNARTFNSFNSFILKGDAPPRMELCYDTLMVRAWDEPDAMYGLLAETVEISEDGNTYTFDLRPEARFHDGSKLTAEDVAFSLMLLKADGHPQISQNIQELKDAEVLEEYRVALHFSGKQTRQLPLVVAGLPILSKRYYTAYDFKQSTLTAPLSSGPYKVGDYAVGRYVEYNRVADYWGKDLPVVVGQRNFDILRIDFYRDYQVGFEAFKKGEVTYREEFSSKIWATEYNFPAVEDQRVIRDEFPDGRPSGAQGWFINTRLEKFKDPRVRRALSYAFDFEWSNKNLFYDLYQRTQSFFENSDMKAEGAPPPDELALLEPYRDQLPESVFETAYVQPVSDGSGFDRSLLREASKLLSEAGYKRDGSALIGPDGNQLKIEFLNNSQAFERITNPFIKNLGRLGIDASFRLVDPAQYQSRLNDYDFDVCSRRYSLSPTLSETIRTSWGSKAAATPGTYNIAGISDPVIDALMDKALGAETRQQMVVAARALDRVLRSGHYWVPQWNKPIHTVAIWDMFGFPAEPPRYAFPIEDLWWIDQEKAEKLGKAG
ncbi:MAG: ABC transporter substrate-binding protein [Roseibium sp.]|uniref:extracellular solute-binding protein n=1 Tax=Roseibium sp. TaxID=1936156 RepID=UPI001B002571|nr:ABC transporter substrate-binding protein [Roseibium sp.]MBO6891808.1 ABC transporter substrate-binding protein [Roseibium sp.]MBO6928369.1 ABC transporter substrate-binding protein [Roseibium sp.]